MKKFSNSRKRSRKGRRKRRKKGEGRRKRQKRRQTCISLVRDAIKRVPLKGKKMKEKRTKSIKE